MTEYTTAPPFGGVEDTTDRTVKGQAKVVGQSAVEAGGDVVGSVKEQGKEVAAETGRQARAMYGRVRTELSDQAGAQQKRAVDGLYALGDEAAKMAEHGGQSGMATQVARQASERIHQAARWLEHREPGHVLEEVKTYARRHPGTFLVGAAVLGVVAGRLAKNFATPSADHADDLEETTPRFEPAAPIAEPGHSMPDAPAASAALSSPQSNRS